MELSDLSEAARTYVRMSNELERLRREGVSEEEEGAFLDNMDRVWYTLTEDDVEEVETYWSLCL